VHGAQAADDGVIAHHDMARGVALLEKMSCADDAIMRNMRVG